MSNVFIPIEKNHSFYWPQMLPSNETTLGPLYTIIPVEIINHIFSFLNAIDLSKASLVCRTFAIVARDVLKEKKYVAHKTSKVFQKFQSEMEINDQWVVANFENLPNLLGKFTAGKPHYGQLNRWQNQYQ